MPFRRSYSLNKGHLRRRSSAALAIGLLQFSSLGAVPAGISGVILTNWDAVGSGVTLLHHYFVWPSFGLLIALVVWRSIARHRTSRIGFSIYLIAMLTTAVLISIAGFWGAKWF